MESVHEVTDAAGHRLTFRFQRARIPESSPLLLWFDGPDRAPPTVTKVSPEAGWNILVPQDITVGNRMGSWWLGRDGDFYVPTLLDRMLEYARDELGCSGELYTAGVSAGGFGALLHGFRLRAIGICASMPHVRLTRCELASRHDDELRSVIGAASDSPYLDATNWIPGNQDTQPTVFLAHTRFDEMPEGGRTYLSDQLFHLTDALLDAGVTFSLFVVPRTGRHPVWHLRQALARFEEYANLLGGQVASLPIGPDWEDSPGA